MSAKITCDEKENISFGKANMWAWWEEKFDLKIREELEERKIGGIVR